MLDGLSHKPPASSGSGWCPSSSSTMRHTQLNRAHPAPRGQLHRNQNITTPGRYRERRGCVRGRGEEERGRKPRAKWEESGRFRGPRRETVPPSGAPA
ncbi:hypothetical protein HPG69_004431 [Diceros bicornis minor]|uniref:Uncharacterized protein n=1 Tax=Diceros bicornis minor TaxID=77932 RepID=A0A7J7F963_DICBM|nr:hypothetical protein HPG69_004431 [Diceros bicornis minor]